MATLSHETQVIISRNDNAWHDAVRTRTMTFPEYLQSVVDLRDESPATFLLSAITSLGAEPGNTSASNHYRALDGLPGVDASVASIVTFLEEQTSPQTETKLLVLAGPPGTLGRDLVSRLVTVAETHSATEEGALYRIAGCRVSDHPLLLLEPSLARRLVREGSIPDVAGSLCETCTRRWRSGLESAEVPESHNLVERFRLGVEGGISQISGADATVADVERAAVQANRGLLVARDIGHMHPASLRVLTDVGRGGTTLVLADADLDSVEEIGRTPDTANCRSQMHIVPLQHSLLWTEERDVFTRHIRSRRESAVLAHVSPLIPEAMAKLAVLSRLQEPLTDELKGGKSRKLVLYEDSYSTLATREAAACVDEGRTGVSTDAIINALTDCRTLPRVDCISLPLVLDRVSRSAGVCPEDIQIVADDYVTRAGRFVRQASIDRFEEEARRFHDKFAYFFRNAQNDCGLRIEEDQLREIEDPDMRDMDREAARADLRRHFEENRNASWRDHPTMRALVVNRLLPSLKHVRKGLSESRFDKDRAASAALRQTVYGGLRDDYEFCDVCAVDTVRVVVANTSLGRIRRGEIEWNWPLNLGPTEAQAEIARFSSI